jgi:cell division protease FtsH
VVFGEISTGAADDLAKATDIARSMVTRYGMAAKLGPVTYESVTTPLLGSTADDLWRPRHYAESTAALIDEQVRALVEDACQGARAILRDHRSVLEETAERLLAKETLYPADLAPLRARLMGRERAA